MYRTWDTPQSLHCCHGTNETTGEGWPDVGCGLGARHHRYHVPYLGHTTSCPQALHCYYGTTGEGWPDVGWEQNHTTKKSRALPRGGPTPLVKKRHHVPYVGWPGPGRPDVGWEWEQNHTTKNSRALPRGGPTPLVQKDTMYRTWDTPQSLHCYYGTTGEGWPGWPDVGWEQNHTTKNSRALPRGGAYPLGTKGHHVMYRTSDTPQSLHCYYGTTGEGWPDVGWEQKPYNKKFASATAGGAYPLGEKKRHHVPYVGWPGPGRPDVGWEQSHTTKNSRALPRGGGGGLPPWYKRTPSCTVPGTHHNRCIVTMGLRERGGLTWGGNKTIQQKIRERYRGGGLPPWYKRTPCTVPGTHHNRCIVTMGLRERGGRGGLTWGGSKTIQQKIRERYRGGGLPPW